MSTTIVNERLLVAGVCAFVLALVLTPIVRQLARRRSALDRPNERSSHVIPMPRVGGISIVAGTIFGGLIAIQYIDLRIALIGAAGTLLAIAGFVDDVENISPLQKYLPQVVAAVIAAFALSPTLAGEFYFLRIHLDGPIANIITAIWIVSFINVLNFMDGIDGMAAGVGAILGLAIPALTNGAGAFMLLPLAAALLGFLAWNTAPASIFMGDVGSQFVGLVLAVGALHWPAGDVQIAPVLLVFSPLLLDTGFTLVRRLVQGQNIFRAHRTHLYQRLTAIGYTHRGVANLYYFMTAMSLGVGVTYLNAGATMQLLLILLMIALGVIYIVVVDRLERGTLKWGFMMPSTGLKPSVRIASSPAPSLERKVE